MSLTVRTEECEAIARLDSMFDRITGVLENELTGAILQSFDYELHASFTPSSSFRTPRSPRLSYKQQASIVWPKIRGKLSGDFKEAYKNVPAAKASEVDFLVAEALWVALGPLSSSASQV